MSAHEQLARRLGTGDAVVIGLGSMIGAGVFAAFTPAAEAAGSWLLLGLLAAGLVAYANATSSARLAARYPESGGTYVYGRERLGDAWGHLAGWAFVVGKTASCAAMALTVGIYVWPDGARWVAAAAVLALTMLNLRGVHKSALATRLIVALVLLVLAAIVAAAWLGGDAEVGRLRPAADGDVGGVLQSAAFLFFAFAGYARIATLGEEVRDPVRTIPRAIPLALGGALLVYAAVASALLAALGADGLAATADPLAAVAASSPWPGLEPVVRAGAAVAALGSLLALILGVSRTTLAMARDGHLPRALAAVHPRFRVPHHAELAVGVVVTLLVLVADLRAVIGFSSFTVLGYYAIANASAWTLPHDAGTRVVPALGLLGCAALAFALPASSVLVGSAVLAVGVAVRLVRRRAAGRGTGQDGRSSG
jgi:APA family basic amino acid/polyamine antiporter